MSWQDEALCAQVGGDLWFPDKGGSSREAKRICGECPVREQCLQYALENDILVGIFGGTSPSERRRILRPVKSKGQKSIAAAAALAAAGRSTVEIAEALGVSTRHAARLVAAA